MLLMSTLQDRAQEAIDAGLKPAQLARAAGVSNAAVSHWLAGRSKALKAESAIGLQKLTGWAADWWITGKGSKAMQSPIVVSHAMGLEDVILLPQLMTWNEVIAEVPLPDRFIAVMPDDQAAPRCPAGAQCVWSTIKPARPGRVVLVKDQQSQLHAREYRQGKAPGEWSASAINPSSVSLDAKEDGLVIVATLAGVIEGDD